MKSIQLILASASPRRKALLKQIGLSFKTHPSQVKEPDYNGVSPESYATELADFKAAEVSNLFPHALVIGADTVVVAGTQVLGKPVDRTSAYEMLTMLSGREHQVITAYSIQLKDLNIVKTSYVSTKVYFKTLDDEEIDTYISSGAPFDKAGAYGIQDYSSIFVDHIEGCFYNVVGFPLSDFNSKLKDILSTNHLILQP